LLKHSTYLPAFLLCFGLAFGQTQMAFVKAPDRFNGGSIHDDNNDPAPAPALITKKQLIAIVDSLLNLDHVDAKEIELVNYYNSLITSKEEIRTVKLFDLNFYEDLDESIIFPPAHDSVLRESLVIEIESEALSYYTTPRQGVVTSLYGWRDKRMHKGIDVDLNKGEPVVSAFDGKVRIAERRGGYGNVVVIMHPNGLETVYAHLSKIKVKEGQVVLSGQMIGLGGSTGHSTGSHLHFEVRYKSHAINPATFISFTDNKLYADMIVLKKTRTGVNAYPINAGFHTVKKGETWNGIAKQYGMNYKELCSLNGTQKRYYLKPGQKIRVN
jgi:murein DD-endopeptidase MepM/ murein hydrolase activator NlpD